MFLPELSHFQNGPDGQIYGSKAYIAKYEKIIIVVDHNGKVALKLKRSLFIKVGRAKRSNCVPLST